MLKIVALLACVYFAAAHICLYDPKQRGQVDISKPSGTCYKPVGPCGKLSPETPAVTLKTGEIFTFHFQQNLNHYSVGSPGYIDVALSKGVPPSGEPEKDSDFSKIDGFIPDYFAHAELKQTNMTYDMLVPEDAVCDHCVVRFRYITHKPGEVIFHQCVDVKIVKNTDVKQEIKKISLADRVKITKAQNSTSNVFAIYYDPSSMKTAALARINTVEPIVETLASLEQVVRTWQSPIDGHVRPLKFASAINDGIVAFIPSERNLYYTITEGGSDLSQVATKLLAINVDSYKQQVVSTLALPVAALHYDAKHDTLIGVFVRNSTKVEANYEYQVVLINRQDGSVKEVTASEPDDYYIDYVWSEYDQSNSMLYILARNEHDPFNQTQKIMVVDMNKAEVTALFPVDYAHSFSSFHLRNGTLYAITQGIPFKQPTAFKYQLYKINPTSKTTEFVYELKNANLQDWNGQVRHVGSSNLIYQVYKPTESPKLSFYPIDVTNASYEPTVANCKKLSHVYNVIALQ